MRYWKKCYSFIINFFFLLFLLFVIPIVLKIENILGYTCIEIFIEIGAVLEQSNFPKLHCLP